MGPRGGGPGGRQDTSELDALQEKLDKLKPPEETKELIDREMKKLRKMSSQSQEYHVGLNYL